MPSLRTNPALQVHASKTEALDEPLSIAEFTGHRAHAVVESLLNRPLWQEMHAVPPCWMRVSVVEPAAQMSQLTWPLSLWYVPVEQKEHATVEASLNLPAEHESQLVWPLLLWNCPAGQDAHSIADVLLYCPATHAVHAVALVLLSVFVTEPAAHNAHADVDALLNLPERHGVQLVAPVDARLSVVEPALHAEHREVRSPDPPSAQQRSHNLGVLHSPANSLRASAKPGCYESTPPVADRVALTRHDALQFAGL